MPGTTPIYGWPYGVLTDGTADLLDVSPLANAIEATVHGGTVSPIGDSSNSQVLTGGDIPFTANDNKNILTTGAITFAHDQWVYLAGHAVFHNQTSSASGLIAIYIDLDAVPIPGMTSGAIWMGPQGSIDERRELNVAMDSVFVTAGSHTFRLRGDRDSTTATHNADSTDSLNQTHHPCSLTVII
jgi:hypothetical protein